MTSWFHPKDTMDTRKMKRGYIFCLGVGFQEAKTEMEKVIRDQIAKGFIVYG